MLKTTSGRWRGGFARVAAIAAVVCGGGSRAGANDAAPASILGRIEIVGQSANIVANPKRAEVILSSDFGLALIDAGTLAVRRVRLGGSAAGIAVSPDGETIYTALSIAQELVAVSAASGEILWRAKLPNFAWHVAITPDGKTVYVTQMLPSDAVAVDAETHEVRTLADAGIRKWPLGLLVSADGKRLLVPSQNVTLIFDAVTFQEVGRWDLPFEGPLGLSPRGAEIYLTGPELVAIDPNSGASLWTLATPTRVGSLVISADGGLGYLLADEELLSVDLAGRRLCQQRTLPETPRALALSGDGSRLFVLTTSKEVLVVDARELSCGPASPTTTPRAS